ncbi:PQQ-binding-like beta-propeller repeat protein [Neorhizobium sp. NCHU2750]|uniref:PQQ-binding-like beta-propeller repeat protein n=1 Tax=Neorhizobium sp. NCHU2750 TaxID=1825976 RepID=UPI000E772066
MTTKTGVTFIRATLDQYLRAINARTGKELWRGRVPAGGQAGPMSYRSSATGKQYLVIAAGGHAGLITRCGDTLVAYALPDQK